jgi:hypothetical protein
VTAAGYLERLSAIEARVHAAAAAAPSSGLTAADPGTGERWEEGQVWAHMSEFVPYWVEQARLVVAGEPSPVPFGRVKTDPVRVETIAERRHQPIEELAEVVLGDISILRGYLEELGDAPAVWAKEGRHATLGVMDLERIFDEFLVGHLEQHLDQLDELAGGRAVAAGG